MSLLPLLLPLSRLALAAPAEAPPRGWVAERARYVVQVDSGGTAHLRVEYDFTPVDARWELVHLLGPGFTVTRTDGPVSAGPAGLDLVLPPTAQRLHFTVEGHLDGRGAAALTVLPATVQTVHVLAPGWNVEVAGEMDGHLAPTDRLSLSWTPGEGRPPPTASGGLVFGETATAAWGDEAELAVRTRVRWRVLRGTAPELRVDVGALRELEVTGPNVATWSQQGSQVVITPRNPDAALFEVDVSGRMPMPPGRQLAVPGATPVGVQRVDRWWMLGKAEELDLIPAPGPAPISARMLPPWARGIAETTPTAWWHGNQGLSFTPVRYEPLMGPDTVVESAEFVAATAAEGRVLLRATWYVRNERRQYLHVTPPEGWRPMTVRVSGDPVTALSDGARGLYVPLEKSVETMKGLVSFPVEVTWIAEGAAWEKKGERTLELPAVDAPIQAAAWQVHLPRGVERRVRRGDDEQLGVAPPPVVTDTDRSDALWLSALKAYKENRWDDAQDYLDDARGLDADNENVARLQSNLDVLNGGARFAVPEAPPPEPEPVEESTGDDGDLLEVPQTGVLSTVTLGGEGRGLGGLGTRGMGSGSMGGGGSSGMGSAPVEPEDPLARRVRDLANAKTAYQMNAEADLTKKAEEAVRAGDYDAAEGYLSEVVDLAKNIGVTQQLENQDQAEVLAEASRTLEAVRKEKDARSRAEAAAEAEYRAAEAERAAQLEAADARREVTYKSRTEIDFEGVDLVGAAEKPDATLVVPPSSVVTGTTSTSTTSRPSQGADEAPVTTTPVTLDKDYLARIPTGRDHLGALEEEAGATGVDSGAATRSGDDTDGEEPVTTDPVTGTFSQEYLERIPTGRSYQSVVQTAAGVAGRSRRGDATAAAGPPPPPPPPPPASADAEEREQLAALGYADDSGRDTESAPRPVAAAPAEARYDSAPSRSRGAALGKKSAPPAPATEANASSGGASSNENTWVVDGLEVSDAPRRTRDVNRLELDEKPMDDEGGVFGGEVGGDLGGQAAPDEPRQALEVSASPFTPALPLDGEAVLHSDALLPADQFPTLTIPYRTRRGG